MIAAARSLQANLDVGIEMSLLDAADLPHRASDVAPREKGSEIAWAIPAAFELGQACLTLAKRGLKANPVSFYIGPGGVGLCKYTSHLEVMLGEDNHCVFDPPNIFASDDELRKQAPTIA